MAETKTIHGSAKRLGVRYGRRTRARVEAIESQSRALHKCPSCSTINVKRVNAGIWQCRKCGHKFTSRAYTVTKAPSFKDAATGTLVEETMGSEQPAAAEASEEVQ